MDHQIPVRSIITHLGEHFEGVVLQQLGGVAVHEHEAHLGELLQVVESGSVQDHAHVVEGQVLPQVFRDGHLQVLETVLVGHAQHIDDRVLVERRQEQGTRVYVAEEHLEGVEGHLERDLALCGLRHAAVEQGAEVLTAGCQDDAVGGQALALHQELHVRVAFVHAQTRHVRREPVAQIDLIGKLLLRAAALPGRMRCGALQSGQSPDAAAVHLVVALAAHFPIESLAFRSAIAVCGTTVRVRVWVCVGTERTNSGLLANDAARMFPKIGSAQQQVSRCLFAKNLPLCWFFGLAARQQRNYYPTVVVL